MMWMRMTNMVEVDVHAYQPARCNGPWYTFSLLLQYKELTLVENFEHIACKGSKGSPKVCLGPKNTQCMFCFNVFKNHASINKHILS